jgi:hypothetical protein
MQNLLNLYYFKKGCTRKDAKILRLELEVIIRLVELVNPNITVLTTTGVAASDEHKSAYH